MPNHASLSRRHFLATAAASAAALAAGSAARLQAVEEPSAKSKVPIGLELYSVRNEMSRDLPATLKAVGKMGYDVVEFYSPYYTWKFPYAKEVRAMLDDLGLRCYSTHNGMQSFAPGDGIGKAIELNQILGARHIVLASAGAKGEDGWKKLAEQLTGAVEKLKEHGLSAGYHNHQAEWKKLENGQNIMEVLAANTPKEFVLQLDVGTAVEVGADPVAWIKANPGRIRCMHVKDWAPKDAPGEKGYRVLFGEGVSPWKEIFAAAESVGGVEFYLLEQEGSRFSELETAKRELELWRSFRAKA